MENWKNDNFSPIVYIKHIFANYKDWVSFLDWKECESHFAILWKREAVGSKVIKMTYVTTALDGSQNNEHGQRSLRS